MTRSVCPAGNGWAAGDNNRIVTRSSNNDIQNADMKRGSRSKTMFSRKPKLLNTVSMKAPRLDRGDPGMKRNQVSHLAKFVDKD